MPTGRRKLENSMRPKLSSPGRPKAILDGYRIPIHYVGGSCQNFLRRFRCLVVKWLWFVFGDRRYGRIECIFTAESKSDNQHDKKK